MIRFAAVSAAAFLAASPAFAGDRFAVSGSVGTLGGQLQAHYKVNSLLSLRGGYNYAEGEFDETYEEIDYTVDADLSGALFAADLHPFGNGFVLSAGVHLADKTLGLDGRPSEPVEIGDTTYTPAEIGTLRGDADLGGTSPYLGFGWNDAFSDGRIGLTAMAGALILDDPTVELTASGPIASDPTFADDLEQEEQNLQDDIDELPFYPVLNIGIVVRF